MYPRTSKVFKPMNSHFSPCSRQQIHRIIQERGECLKSHPGTCGNGVRDGAEECDCGWEKSCSHLDSCCTPSDAKPPEKGCTFRKNCSPKESKCCKRDCTVNPANGTECYKSEAKCLVSLCDGVHATCPKPKQSPDRYPCQRTSKTCSRGHCNSSVCLDNNLQECTCDNQRYSCLVCCKNEGACFPAQKLYLQSPYGSVFNALEGTPCKEGGHQCDGSGSCINAKDRKLEVDEDPNRITYWVWLSCRLCYL
ncbi:hypothetical protein JTE90_006002 [Oedothorax gibbosus]|uniref:Disintegrin domain-containing protein n=1 Tax=Oedothorax gibbosus TaxID=931172 RepID=A0AAV6TJ69_9ARAC|nr:hypothetical protein JTE90_006002 [Oedothorax gibbosus]